MKTQSIVVVSLHPGPDQPLAFDLKEILQAFGSQLQSWIWCIRNLDWLGEHADAICLTLEAAGPGGIWMTSEELVHHARNVFQTIEGEFLAFPREIDSSTVSEQELGLRAFPASRAELAIVAVDGSFFEVFAKETEKMTDLRAFCDVRAENPDNYF